jgi:hypothetical protein
MIELDCQFLTQVSGAAYVTAEYEHSSGPGSSSSETMYISCFPTDGSLPKEFQDRIDAGASWDEMAPWLIMYSIIRETHPEFFIA